VKDYRWIKCSKCGRIYDRFRNFGLRKCPAKKCKGLLFLWE